MDEQMKSTIKTHIELAHSRMDDANEAASQSATNGALMAAMSHLLYVVEQQQTVIEAQQAEINLAHKRIKLVTDRMDEIETGAPKECIIKGCKGNAVPGSVFCEAHSR